MGNGTGKWEEEFEKQKTKIIMIINTLRSSLGLTEQNVFTRYEPIVMIRRTAHDNAARSRKRMQRTVRCVYVYINTRVFF